MELNASSALPASPSRDYSTGFNHGYEAALLGKPKSRASEPSSFTKLLATGTFLSGMVGALALIGSQKEDSATKDIALTIAVSGMILGATLSAVRVLGGDPTPSGIS